MSRSMTPEKGFCLLRHEKTVMELFKVSGVTSLLFVEFLTESQKKVILKTGRKILQ